MRTLAALTTGASLLLLTTVGCAAGQDTPAPQDLTSTAYSLTQTIRNNSGLDLTVLSVDADNNATITPGAPTSIAAGTTGTFAATNTGNGIQLKVTLTGPGGQVLLVDSDVPRVNGNWSSATLSGTPGGLSAGAISMGDKDTPTADFTVESCAAGARCTTTATTYPAPVVKATP